MKESWWAVEDRLGRLEGLQRNQTGEISSLTGRMKINERDVMNIKKTVETNVKKVDDLAEEVKNLKVQLGEAKPGGAPSISSDSNNTDHLNVENYLSDMEARLRDLRL